MWLRRSSRSGEDGAQSFAPGGRCPPRPLSFCKRAMRRRGSSSRRTYRTPDPGITATLCSRTSRSASIIDDNGPATAPCPAQRASLSDQAIEGARRPPARSPVGASADELVDDDLADRGELRAREARSTCGRRRARQRPRRPATQSCGQIRIVSWLFDHRRGQPRPDSPCIRCASRRTRRPSTASRARWCGLRHPRTSRARRGVRRRR